MLSVINQLDQKTVSPASIIQCVMTYRSMYKKYISIISENCPQKLSEPLAGFQLYDYLKEMIYSILISYCKNTLHLSILKKSQSDCRLKLVSKVWIILLSSIFLLLNVSESKFAKSSKKKRGTLIGGTTTYLIHRTPYIAMLANLMPESCSDVAIVTLHPY